MSYYMEEEQGKCPFCESYNIEYGAMELEDDTLYYPWKCEDCGCEGKDWYELKFIKQEIEEEE